MLHAATTSPFNGGSMGGGRSPGPPMPGSANETFVPLGLICSWQTHFPSSAELL